MVYSPVSIYLSTSGSIYLSAIVLYGQNPKKGKKVLDKHPQARKNDPYVYKLWDNRKVR